MSFQRTRKKDSGLGTGDQSAILRIGIGQFVIDNLSVKGPDAPYAVNGIVYYFQRCGDGTYKYTHLMSGHASYLDPLIKTGPMYITGPGQIDAAFNHPVSGRHALFATYRLLRRGFE